MCCILSYPIQRSCFTSTDFSSLQIQRGVFAPHPRNHNNNKVVFKPPSYLKMVGQERRILGLLHATRLNRRRRTDSIYKTCPDMTIVDPFFKGKLWFLGGITKGLLTSFILISVADLLCCCCWRLFQNVNQTIFKTGKWGISTRVLEMSPTILIPLLFLAMKSLKDVYRTSR